jgi:hypothetical protein
MAEEIDDISGEDGWIPAAGRLETSQQLSRELCVIAVLAEGELRVGPFTGSAGTEPAFYIQLGGLGRSSLDHESESIAQCLAQDRAGEAIRGHP